MSRCTLFFATLLMLFSQWTFASYRIGVSIARVDDNFMTYVHNGLEQASSSSRMPKAMWFASSIRWKALSTRRSMP